MFCCIRILSKKLSLQIRVTLRALLQWFRVSCDSVLLTSETLNNTHSISLWTLRISSLLLLLLADGKFQSFASKRAVKAALKRWCQTRFLSFLKAIRITERSSSSLSLLLLCVFFFREKSSSILRLVGGLCERRRSASSDVKEGERRGPRETRTK